MITTVAFSSPGVSTHEQTPCRGKCAASSAALADALAEGIFETYEREF